MQLNHIHVGVRDLPGALAWMERVWQLRPGFQNERLAVFAFPSFQLLVDASPQDTVATIGFEAADCDGAFSEVVGRGAEVITPPADQPWGSRAAYLRGPAKLTFEIEGPVKQEAKAGKA